MKEKQIAKEKIKEQRLRKQKKQEALERLNQRKRDLAEKRFENSENRTKIETIKEARQNVNSGRGVFQEIRGWANLASNFRK